ncbi:MAG TPA: BTAD domain-containing putative transcriptional regulator, partial [Chloroflexaceae bacterium]|nr:BTAD domain-containing putative transcriptional regulator [Chloroflexaceae bacterium]
MTQLRLFVFGPPRLERDGHPVELGLRRALALLVYLAVSRQPQSRDTLATLLWPDSDQREARANLRRTLHRLGQAIGDDLLATSAETVGVAPGAPLWVDSQAFLDLAGSAEGQEAAARLYGDDFLAGFSLPDSPAFDEWQFFERERLRQLLAQTLEQLTMGARARGAWDAAADHARRWVALDVLHEPAQRALLEAYAQAGQAAAAIRQYQELARTLEAELGAEPEEATTALFEAIRTRRFPPPSSPPPAEAPRPAHVAPAPPPPAAPPLVGRERELGDLLGLLGAEGGPRLVTLTGPGGAGKTRLAQAVVEQSGPRLAHGAQLVSLAEVAGPEGIAPAIAARLGLPAGDGDLEARLLGALHERELLLALDNFEHLLDGAALVAAILAAAPRARLLVTSRERLGVADEAVYPLGGLELPADDDGGSALEAASARLLLQRARLVRPELAPGPADVAAIARICRLVQGMPLALTLAASWAELLSFDEIAGEIGRSLDFLATDQRGVPERQRSVRAVFEGSWRRLPADVQRVFARLTVFHGGFTRRAAEAVAGAGLPALRRLVNSSFITVSDQAQRYEIHELLRQLAAEAAEGDPDVAAARGRHAALYLAMVGGLTANLKGPGQKQAVLALDADADNLRAAWRHAAAQGDRAALAGAAEGLWLYWELRGALREGEGLLREAADVVEAAGGADAAGLAGFLRAGQGHLAARRGEWAAGSATMEQGVALLRAASAASPGWLALALPQLGFLNRFQERHGEAARLGEESLALFAAADDSWGVAYSLLLMGTALERQGKPALAAQLLQTCLERARELEDAATCSFAAWNLGRARMSFGDFAQARRLFDEAIALAGELGHTLSLGSALMERGLLGLTTGALEQAEADFAAGAGHFAAIGAVWEEAWARTGLGAVAHGRGELERAEAQLRAGLRAARSIGRPWHTARCLSVLGLVALDRGDRPAAVALQREALAMMREAGHEPRVALCATRLAGALLAHGQADDEARGLLHEALALSLRHQLAPTAIEACVVATRLALTDGRLG